MHNEKTIVKRPSIRHHVGGHRSDLDYDFGARTHHGPGLTDRWRLHHLEEEHGIRLDALRAAGLMG